MPLSGIPEIDSLPLHDWRTQDKRLSYPVALGLATLIPGGGQFYGGHPVRGSFLLGMETILLGLSVNTFTQDLPRRDQDTRRYLDSAAAAAGRGEQGNVEQWTSLARKNAAQRLDYADLANSQLAWAIGLHIYGILDAFEIVQRSRNPDPPIRSVKRAFLYGLVFPGGGQIYNGDYGKFGMLWMAFGASAVSAWSRQNVVNSLNRSLKVERADEAAGFSGSNVSQMVEDRTLYRKRRNQYYWGIALFDIYAIMDGMVDAALSDFDKPNRFAIGQGGEPMSFVASLSF